MKAKIFTILFLACNSMYAQIPSNGLVAFFPFFGNSKDSSVNKTHGTVSNATLTSDRYGNPNGAYQFSGSSNSNIQFSVANVQNNRYTYSLWAKINQLPSTGNMAFALNIGGTSGDQSLNIANNYGGGAYNGWLGGGYNTVAPNFGLQEGNNLSTSNWTHVVCVRDSTYALLYIDGVLVDSIGSSSVKYPYYGTGTKKAVIGMRNDGSGPFNGKIDDVCIYNRALSKSEVLALYQDQTTTSVENLLANSFSVNVYPNPSSNMFFVALENQNESMNDYSVIVTNLVGQQMTVNLQNTNESNISVYHNLVPGVYTIQVKNTITGFINSQKLIVE